MTARLPRVRFLRLSRLLLALLTCLSAGFLCSCEDHQRVREHGELIKCPVIEKYTLGSQNPAKGLSKRHYLRLHILPSGEQRAILVDQGTYNAAEPGDLIHGYYLEGQFVVARGAH